MGTIVTQAARCAGWEGYRNSRSHLVRMDRLSNPTVVTSRGTDRIQAQGACPVCGFYWDGLVNYYDPATLTGTRVPSVKCGHGCLNSTSGECRCSCAGANHGAKA